MTTNGGVVCRQALEEILRETGEKAGPRAASSFPTTQTLPKPHRDYSILATPHRCTDPRLATRTIRLRVADFTPASILSKGLSASCWERLSMICRRRARTTGLR